MAVRARRRVFLSRVLHRPAGRGVTQLEFALVLPIMLFMVFLTLDLGRLVMSQTALHEAVTVGARAGARVGYAGGTPGTGCEGSRSGANPTYNALCETAKFMPGGTAAVTRVLIKEPTRGVCTQSTGLYVTVQAEATVELLTPGLGAVLGVVNGSGLSGGLTATGTARCEVARR